MLEFETYTCSVALFHSVSGVCLRTLIFGGCSFE